MLVLQEISDRGTQEVVEPEEYHQAMDTLEEDTVVEPKEVEHKEQERVKTLLMQL